MNVIHKTSLVFLVIAFGSFHTNTPAGRTLAFIFTVMSVIYFVAGLVID